MAVHDAAPAWSDDGAELLELSKIRAALQRMEETIVFSLIERSQFLHNKKIYERGAFVELQEKEHFDGSWLQWTLKEVETSYAKLGRWKALDEYPYTPLDMLPEPILKPVRYPILLHSHNINETGAIYAFYTDAIVPSITNRNDSRHDDGQYGSSAVCDSEALSALSRRIHYGVWYTCSELTAGLFVAESKFRSKPTSFVPLIRARDRDGLAALITKPEVEEALLKRIAQKAEVYGQDLDNATAKKEQRKIQVNEVVRLYKEYVIPLTKKVEVCFCFYADGAYDQIDYLLERCVTQRARRLTTGSMGCRAPRLKL